MSGFKKWLRLIIVFALCLAIFGCQETKSKGEAEAPNILNDVEQKTFEEVNNYRLSKGLQPLSLDQRIVEQARKHSQNMADKKVPFSHEGFEERVAATKIPRTYAAENVAYNQGYSDPAARAVEGWIQSEGHRRNIVGDFDLTGIGAVKSSNGTWYFTQIFLRTSGQTAKKSGFSWNLFR